MEELGVELAQEVAKQAVKEIEKDRSFAWELIANSRKDSKRWFIALLVVLSMWFATIGVFIWYINQYDYTSYEVKSEDGGNANYIGQDGDIHNGESESSKKD